MNTALIFSEPIASFRGSIELGERLGTSFRPVNPSPNASTSPPQARAARRDGSDASTYDRAFAQFVIKLETDLFETVQTRTACSNRPCCLCNGSPKSSPGNRDST
jgi:hypothetical protein